MELPELQHAIRGVPGVATANMRWPDPDGPVTLRVTFTPDAERDVVTEQILQLVRASDGVDQETIEVDRPLTAGRIASETRSSANGLGSRPILLGLSLSDKGLDMNVTVELEANQRRVVGHADGIAAPGADLRVAAAATLDAVRDFLPDDIRVDLEWLAITEVGTVHGSTRIVQAAVTCLSPARGVEWLYGSAPVRGDARDAAARATLDALNRRLEQFARAS